MHTDEDVILEENNEDGSEANTAQKIQKLRDKIAILEQEKGESLIGWQRSKADFVNAQRRFEEEKTQLRSMVAEDIFSELLPVLDSFDQAALSIPPDSPAHTGFTNISSLLKKIMEHHGLTPIDSVDVPEDPRIHESLQMIPATGSQKPHHVAQVLQKGYKLGDRVIRAAKVIVTE